MSDRRSMIHVRPFVCDTLLKGANKPLIQVTGPAEEVRKCYSKVVARMQYIIDSIRTYLDLDFGSSKALLQGVPDEDHPELDDY
jgi:hypothetical protein